VFTENQEAKNGRVILKKNKNKAIIKNPVN
jgi:hypothetical protein